MSRLDLSVSWNEALSKTYRPSGAEACDVLLSQLSSSQDPRYQGLPPTGAVGLMPLSGRWCPGRRSVRLPGGGNWTVGRPFVRKSLLAFKAL
jgi:hypothetical protein